MRFLGLLGIIGALAIPLFVVAHSEGASYEETIDGIIVDIGYEPEAPYAGDTMSFDFNLYDAADPEKELPFSSVWVRIEQDNKTLLAAGIAKPEFGVTSLLFVTPSEGEVMVHARFERDGETLTTASFPVEVQSWKKETLPQVNSVWVVVGAIVGAVLVWFIRRRHA